MKIVFKILGSLFIVLFLQITIHSQADWSRYESRTLQSIIDTYAPEVAKQSPGVSFGEEFPSQVVVTYMGKLREVPASRKGCLNMWVKVLDKPKIVLDMFKTEILFKEGTVSYWLPVQEQSLPYYKEELQPGDRVKLFLMLMAANKDLDGKVDYIFLVNEFQKIDSAQ